MKISKLINETKSVLKGLVGLEGENIILARKKLKNFEAATGKIEVKFTLPTGEIITVPVRNKKVNRVISREIGNYLAERQLALTEERTN